MTEKEKDIIWRGWRKGLTHDAIATKIGKTGACVFLYIQKYGGIKPQKSRRRPGALTLDERVAIAEGLAERRSLRDIAKCLYRHPSTICREVARNSWRRGYDAHRGEKETWKRARRPKAGKLAQSPGLRSIVAAKLASDWSPEQISGWLSREYRRRDAMQISYETIYKNLYTPSKNVLGRECAGMLRTGRRIRRCRTKTQKGGRHSPVANGTPLSKRPAAAASRSERGHWEGDLLTGNHGSYLASLVDRRTRFTILVRLPGKQSAAVTSALGRRMNRLPASLKKSLTWDRGSEMTHHASFARQTGIPVFFCKAGCPWQRGSNENVNGLLRQYLPKQWDFTHLSQRELDELAQRLNTRPKKVLGFRTPEAEMRRVLR